MEAVQSFLDHYGYLALLFGAFLEGETVLVLAGLAAHRGYLHLPWVIFCAFLGTLISDEIWFYLGRWRGRALLAKRAAWQARAHRVQRLLQRHRIKVVLGFRCLYGLRNITPLVIGASGFPPIEFLVLNTIAAALWASTFVTVGYLFGNAVAAVLDDVHRYEVWIFAFAAAIATGVCVILALRNRRGRKPIKIVGETEAELAEERKEEATIEKRAEDAVA